MKIDRKAALTLAACLVLAPATLAENAETPVTLSVPVDEFRLPNGLRVILHEDRSTPIVAVNIWYHVGSKNEVVGRTGFAHLFEHMMFQGSKNYDADYFTPLQEAGATINGSTNADRTNYYEVVPSNFLELALFMEADRMGGLLEAMTLPKLNNQRDVVKNERRQNYDNRPYGTSFERMSALLYPENHPYRWPTIGSLEDLTAASEEDVKAFFRQYYVPDNAVLTIAGDFKKDDARRWVEKYFGPIPRGVQPIVRPDPPAPKLDQEVRVSYRDNVRLPRIFMAWHTVAQFAPDDAALDMLATVLSSGRGSRLQSSLIYEKQIAQDVGAGQQSREISGVFQVQATARPGQSIEAIEKEILDQIERIKNAPPTADEMERALTQTEAGFVFGLQTVLGKANQLNSYAIFRGRPDFFSEDLARYRRVTAAEVQRVARQYLNQNRVVMTYLPQTDEKVRSVTDAAANQPTSVESERGRPADASRLPKPGPNPKLNLPRIERSKLPGGLEVLLVRQTELPVVSMNLVLKTGGTADPTGRAGLALLTADLLTAGTEKRSALEISNQLQAIGAGLNVGANWDSSSASLTTLTKNLDTALDIFSDVVVRPVFPEIELETRRRRLLGAILQRRDNADAIASIAYDSVLYGEKHPYGQVLSGDEASIKAINRADTETFYRTYYRPNNAVLIVVGDVTMKEIAPKLGRAFADWKAADVPRTAVPATSPRDRAVLYLVDKPGAAQSVIRIGQVGVARDTPDYFPLVVMNAILGGQFSSRVNMNLRENKGYTYGARTGWEFRRGAGPFTASAGVQTAVTKESVVEFLKELRGIRGDIAVTAPELEYNKQSLIRRFPSNFETVGQVSGQLANLVIYNLPDTYFNDYIARINAVTLQDIERVANRYLDPSTMAILVVGDRTVIEPKLKEISGLDIRYLDTEGKPIR
ncbi:MAG: pitrilysin family protein [Capsulimonadales bacterium]|nr:pitrilysin family protein [Capsulimonadales bacterium]